MGGGLAGLLLATKLAKHLGRVAIIEANFAQAVPPWFLVHRFPGKRLATDSVNAEAFECATSWLRGLSDDGPCPDVLRVGNILRPEWKSDTLGLPSGVDVLSHEDLGARYPQVRSQRGSCLLYSPAWSGFGRRVLERLKADFLKSGGVWVDGVLLTAERQPRLGKDDGGWSVSTSVGVFACRRLALALGANLKQWLPWNGLSSNSGSLMRCSLRQLPFESGLDVVVSSGGHIAPLPDGTFVVGSTYRHDVRSSQELIDSEERQALWRITRRLVSLEVDENSCECWSGERATVPQDKQPIVGEIPESGDLFVLGGLASRGFFWAPWLASKLASEILTGVSSLPEEFGPKRVKGYKPTDRLSKI